jgi:ribonuclease HII
MVGCTAIRSSRLLPLPPAIPDRLADSKMLTERERERLFGPLSEFADAWAVGAASNKEIDEAGITHALGLAALRALAACEERLMAPGRQDRPDAGAHADTHAADGHREAGRSPVVTLAGAAGILDGPYDYISRAAGAMDAPEVPLLPRITTQVRADAGCALVSAASDLAKVTRDRLMERLSEEPGYAVYGWESNKGYGTAVHRAAIAEHGPSDLHRLTWHLV